MIKHVVIILSLLWAIVVSAQTKDTIQLVKYAETLLPVMNNEVKTIRDLKPLFKTHPETFAAWKKARNSERLSALFLVLNFVGTSGILLFEKDNELLIFLGISVVSLSGLYLNYPVKSRRLKYAVELYNQRIRLDNKTDGLSLPRQ